MATKIFKISKKTVFFFAGVRPKTIYATMREILAVGQRSKKKDVEIILSSTGGNCEASFAFYDIIRDMTNIPLTMVATGEVASSAIVLLLTAEYEKRFITENGTLFLHEVSLSHGEEVTINDKDFRKLPTDIQESIIIAQETIIKIVSKQTGLKPKKVLKMMRKKTILNAEQAVKYGFACKIIPT